jgi:Flp pilus assembly protein TadG
MIRKPLSITLARNTQGSAAAEFAMVAPVFLMLLLGMFDAGQMVYGKSVLNGAVAEAARTSSLETGDIDDADARVEELVSPALPNVQLTSVRKSYYDFADINRAEVWNDGNGNGLCDNNESYTDENNNTQWDADIGMSGNGGANDVVVYTVTAKYDPVFKIPFMPAKWNQRTLTSTAVKKNQPFANQQAYSATARICS